MSEIYAQRNFNIAKHTPGVYEETAMSAKLAAILARRIHRLNQEFAIAKRDGRHLAPFLRRARSLSIAWLNA